MKILFILTALLTTTAAADPVELLKREPASMLDMALIRLNNYMDFLRSSFATRWSDGEGYLAHKHGKTRYFGGSADFNPRTNSFRISNLLEVKDVTDMPALCSEVLNDLRLSTFEFSDRYNSRVGSMMREFFWHTAVTPPPAFYELRKRIYFESVLSRQDEKGFRDSYHCFGDLNKFEVATERPAALVY